MASTSTTLQVAQAATVFASSATAGLSLGLSIFVIPRLLESPVPLMLQQWARMFSDGQKLMPGLASATGLAYFALAYAHWSARPASRAADLYLAAGGLCASFVPFTLAVILPTNQKLFQKVKKFEGVATAAGELLDEEVGVAKEETAKYLVDQWGFLNLGRSVILAAASLLGLAALL